MTNFEIGRDRLYHQRISAAPLPAASAVVDWLCAVQAQDYAGAKWALALRMQSATDSDLDRAFAAGDILRTHLMRPTWHFVTPKRQKKTVFFFLPYPWTAYKGLFQED